MILTILTNLINKLLNYKNNIFLIWNLSSGGMIIIVIATLVQILSKKLTYWPKKLTPLSRPYPDLIRKILILSWTWSTSKYPIYRKLQEYTGSKWIQKGYNQIIIMIPGSSKCVKFVILWFLCLFIWKTYINLPKNKYFKYLEIWKIWVYRYIM